jgi:hypothetical protein
MKYRDPRTATFATFATLSGSAMGTAGSSSKLGAFSGER